MPDEGCMLWTDNMLIPVGAPNTAAALAFMNYVYDPEVAADITEYVQYISPVDGVKEILVDRDPKIANNQLIFPDEKFTENCTIQVSPEDEQTVNEAFESVLTGCRTVADGLTTASGAEAGARRISADVTPARRRLIPCAPAAGAPVADHLRRAHVFHGPDQPRGIHDDGL